MEQKKKTKEKKIDVVLYFSILGWAAIVAIWIWQAIKQCLTGDCGKGGLYFLVAAIFLFIAIKSIRDYLIKRKAKIKTKKK